MTFLQKNPPLLISKKCCSNSKSENSSFLPNKMSDFFFFNSLEGNEIIFK